MSPTKVPFSALLFTVITLLFPPLGHTLPTEGEVVGGAASIRQPTAKSIHVEQVTERAILSWRGFDIAVDELVQFNQPSAASVALNRIWGGEPTVILGQLRANGRVFLMNPNGVLFGVGAVVNVAGLAATTLPIRDSDFLAGHYRFEQDPAQALAAVINRGRIQVSDQGFVFFAAPGVSNEGVIVANLGSVLLGSTTAVTLDLMGTGLISYALDGKVLSQVTGPDGQSLADAVRNDGTIQADGGKVILAARAAGDIFSSVVNQSGLIQARSLVGRGGEIELVGGDPVQNMGEVGWQANLGKVQNADGWVQHTGTLDVSAAEAGAAQGEVTLSGQFVGSSGEIEARGADGATGGRVLVTSSEKTVLTNTSQIDTSGAGSADAGNVIVWSDRTTLADGVIVARGGDSGGNGGQVEVSGHEVLNMYSAVDAAAPYGARGTLLLDPRNITVANGGTAALADVDSFSDTPSTDVTIAPATINTSTANVVLQANNDITVNNDIRIENSNVSLTLQAGRSIGVNAGIFTSTATSAGVFFTANDPGALPANRDPGPGAIILSSPGFSISNGPISFNGPVIVNTDLNLGAGSGNVTFASTLDGGFNLAVFSSGITSFGGAVGSTIPLRSLRTAFGGTTQINSGSVTTLGGQTYDDAVVLGGNTLLTASNGPIAFLSTVNGARDLVVSSSNSSFFGAIGATTPLNTFAATSTSATVLRGGTVTTAGAQTYNSPVAIGADTTLNSGSGDITFASALTSDSTSFSLTTNSTGLTTFGGPVGVDIPSIVVSRPLLTLTTNLGGTTRLNGGSVITTGAQTYNDMVTLGANTTLDAGTGNIMFASTLNGGFSLTANSSGSTTFMGVVGGITPLGSLTTNAGGTSVITSGSVTTSGVQSYNDPVTLMGPTTLAGGSFPLNSITSTSPVTITATTGDITDNLQSGVFNIFAPTATLTAASGIGRLIGTDFDFLLTGVNTLHASTTNGLIAVVDGDAISLGTISASGGPVAIGNFTGNITISGSVTSTTHGVGLEALAGSILGTAGATPHVNAVGSSVLAADAGVLGTMATPLRVNVTGADLGVAATSQVGGLSGSLTGTVSNGVFLLNSPPAPILFNGVPVMAMPSPGGSAPGGSVPGTLFQTPGASVGVAYLNPNAIVPGTYLPPSGVLTPNSVVAGSVTSGLITGSGVSIEGGSESVAGAPGGDGSSGGERK